MKLIKSFAVALSILLSISAMAQKPTFEISLGGGSSNYVFKTAKVLGTSIKTKFDGIGARAGFATDIYSSKVENLYMNTGAFLSCEGVDVKVEGYTASYNPYFLNIPIHIGYKFDITDNFSLFADGGAFFGVGLFGSVSVDKLGIDMDVDIFGNENGVNRFQTGLGFKAGLIAWSHIRVFGGCDWNLLKSLNLNSVPIFDKIGRFNHNNVFIGVSYIF